ncbi:MAG: FHA domain-containing protein, partial [Flavobacteriales bacterium]|nr:FHA domain-containing protein [Flavobacteriales bacterium]
GELKDDCGIFGGGTFLVQGTFTVGRGEGSTLKFPSSIKEVSRNHAALKQEGSFMVVTDLGSSNGTLVNDEWIKPNTPIRLQPGDKVCFGKKRYCLTVQ